MLLWRQEWGAGEHTLELTDPALAKVPPALVGLVAVVGRAEHDAVTFLYQTASDVAASVASAVDGVVDWVGDQASAGVAWTAGVARKVGAVTVEMVDDTADAFADGFGWAGQRVQQGYGAVLDLFTPQTVKATLTTAPPPGPGLRRMTSLMDQVPVSNTPAYIWLPILVPAQVQWLTFDFEIAGDGKQDALVFGLNGTNLFTLATEFIPAAGVQTSSLIDVAPYAGTTNEFFFGVVGGTSTNCTITVEGLRFYTFAAPALSITNAGGATLLSWPTTAVGYSLETTATLSPSAWMPVTNPPTILGSQYVVTNVWPDQTRFFRLRQE